MKVLKIFSKISQGIYWLIIGGLIVVSLCLYFSVFKIPGNFKLLVVQSGSMEPAIKTGSVILIQKQDTYFNGDIISFTTSGKDSTTHRIVRNQIINGKEFFTTKGDANQGEDREIVSVDQVLGKTKIIIPYLGYLISFAKTQKGLIFLIVIPATIIIFSEILNLKKEITNFIKSRKQNLITVSQDQ